MLLDLAGLGAGATGLREIRGNCVYNVLVRQGRHSRGSGIYDALPPVYQCSPNDPDFVGHRNSTNAMSSTSSSSKASNGSSSMAAVLRGATVQPSVAGLAAGRRLNA